MHSRDQALKIIQSQLGQNSRRDKMNFDEFNRIFCKGIFKDALITVNKNFGTTLKTNEAQEVTLSVKIGEYQRKQMLQGLEPGSQNFQQGRQILNSLNNISERV